MFILRYVYLPIAVFTLLFSVALAEDGVWQKVSSPYVLGQTEELSIGHYGGTRYIFAADTSEFGTLWMTTDNGQWWDRSHDLEGHYHPRVVIQENDFQFGWTIARNSGGTDDFAGPYRTTNRGEQWNLRDTGLEDSKRIYALDADQSSTDMDVAYIGCIGVSGNNFKKLFKTTNGGASWLLSQTGFPTDAAGVVYDISISQSQPNIIWCAFYGQQGGLFRSFNGGENWEYIAFDGARQARAVAVDPNDPDKVYVTATNSEQIFKSVNATSPNPTWEQIADEFGRCWNITVDNSGNAYFPFNLAGDYGDFVGRYDGSQFTLLPTGVTFLCNRQAYSVAVDPLDTDIICVGTKLFFEFSDDFGATFDQRVDGTNPERTTAFDVDLPVMCVTRGSRIYKSTDRGLHWTARICNLEGRVSDIQKDWGEASLWYAGLWAVDGPHGSLYASWDDGDAWFKNWYFFGLGIRVLSLMPDSVYLSDYVYLGVEGMGAETGKFLWSSNNGQSWYESYPSSDPLIRSISVHSTSPEKIIIADYGGGAYRSTDRGQSWEQIISGLSNTDSWKINYCPGQPDIALIGTEAGVFKCTNINDATPTWSAANYGASADTVVAIDFHANDNSIVLRSTKDDGVGTTYISADTARSWIEINTGLNDLIIHDIASDIDYPDTFYVATDDGVYKLKNPVKSGTISSPGATWGPGLVIVNGDVTVESDATLIIEEGTEVLFVYDFDKDGGGASPAKSELIVNGKLKALGNENEPIVFMSSDPNPEAGDWYGIRALAGSIDSLAYCEIRHAEYGIKAESPSVLVVENCTIKDNYTAGIHMTSPPTSTKIRYSNISDCGTYGIYASGNEFLAHSDTISGNRYGIYYIGDDSPTIESCLITYPRFSPISSYYGIYADSPSGTAEVTVSADSIHGFDQGGIYFHKIVSKGVITKTKIVSCSVFGIRYEYSNADILGGGASNKNHIEDNTYGLHMSGSGSPDVRRTKFLNNASYGAYIAETCSPNFGTEADSGRNSFIREGSYAAYYDLYKAGILSVQAQNNWWEEDPPTSAEIYNALYDPWLDRDLLHRIAPDWDRPELTQDFDLAKAYPNPFNPTTIISFNLSSPQFVTVKVFNIMGQEVRVVFAGHGSAGENTVVWDGKNDRGKPVSAGVYLVQMQTSERQRTIKTTVLK